MMKAEVAVVAWVAVLFAASFGEAASCGSRFQHQDLEGGIRQWVVGGVDATRGAYPWQVRLSHEARGVGE